jgi:hypothetical protein
VTLAIALVNLFVQAAFKVLIACFILFLIGLLYPFLASVLGLPYQTVWELLSSLGSWLSYLWNSTIVIDL